MPREKRDALLREREILGFLEQSQISPKNLARLRVLGRSENTRIANLAHLVLDVGAATPYRRRRIRTLALERRDILKQMEEVGLIMPLPPAPGSPQGAYWGCGEIEKDFPALVEVLKRFLDFGNRIDRGHRNGQRAGGDEGSCLDLRGEHLGDMVVVA